MSASALRILSHVPVPLLRLVREAHPDVEIVAVPEEGPVPASVCGEVLLTQAWGSPNLGEVVARGVRWVHAYGTGVNEFPYEALGDRVLTCSRGASAVPIAEFVLAAMLAHEKDFPATWIREAADWRIRGLGGLHGKQLGLVGVGGIGQAVATRALAFGMRVRALRRSDAASPVPGVEIVHELSELLAGADHVVLAAPVTKETRGLIDRRALAHLEPGAHLVNVARGELVDQGALREALDEGRVARASLDVAHPEPLPKGHWLYSHPNVRLSPHISWSMPGALDWLVEPFVENLGRYRRADPLLYEVSRELGY